MALDSRDYYRDPGDGGAMGRLTKGSATTWLLGILAVVFILDSILSTGAFVPRWLSPSRWGVFTIDQALYGGQVWRFLTYQFFHAGFFHILFNGIGLYFFGPLMEQWWGKRRFIAFYLLCGISGSVLFLILSFIPGFLRVGPETALLGASGSIFGILAACAVLFPNQRVQLLFPPIPMSMRTMALIFLGISVLSLVTGGQNAGGDAAHLGGAILGVLLVKTPSLLAWAEPRHSVGLKRRLDTMREDHEAKREAHTQQQVDAILDKVRDQGLQSLTAKEKKVLKQATDRQRSS